MPAPVAGPIITPDNPLWTAPTQNLSLEQDALRWRELSRRLTAIEQALGTTVRFNQVAAPGGSEILGQTIRVNLLTVSDGVLTQPRVSAGNLLSYTGPNGVNSPAQYGERVLDASGNVISDSLGLSQVMTQLAAAFAGSTFNVTSGTPTLITGATITFSLTRAISVLIAYGSSWSVPPTGDGGTDTVDLFIDGVNKSAAGNGPALELQFAVTSGGSATSSGVYAQSLATGSHTVELRAARNGTNTPTVLQAGVAAYNMGK